MPSHDACVRAVRTVDMQMGDATVPIAIPAQTNTQTYDPSMQAALYAPEPETQPFQFQPDLYPWADVLPRHEGYWDELGTGVALRKALVVAVAWVESKVGETHAALAQYGTMRALFKVLSELTGKTYGAFKDAFRVLTKKGLIVVDKQGRQYSHTFAPSFFATYANQIEQDRIKITEYTRAVQAKRKEQMPADVEAIADEMALPQPEPSYRNQQIQAISDAAYHASGYRLPQGHICNIVREMWRYHCPDLRQAKQFIYNAIGGLRLRMAHKKSSIEDHPAPIALITSDLKRNAEHLEYVVRYSPQQRFDAQQKRQKARLEAEQRKQRWAAQQDAESREDEAIKTNQIVPDVVPDVVPAEKSAARVHIPVKKTNILYDFKDKASLGEADTNPETPPESSTEPPEPPAEPPEPPATPNHVRPTNLLAALRAEMDRRSGKESSVKLETTAIVQQERELTVFKW